MATRHQAHPIVELLAVLAGPAIWFTYFGLAYGTQSLLCAMAAEADEIDPTHTRLVALLGAATLVALLGLTVVIWSGVRQHGSVFRVLDQENFLAHLQVTMGGLSAFAVLSVAIAVVLLPPCMRVFG